MAKRDLASAKSLSGSAAQSKVQLFPGDADYFEWVNVQAWTREEACRILADVMRSKALDELKDHYELVYVRWGSHLQDVVKGGKEIAVGTTLSLACPTLPPEVGLRTRRRCLSEQDRDGSPTDPDLSAGAQEPPHVLVDSWYHCKSVRRSAQKRGWDLSGGLKSNRVMRLMAEDGSREWLKLSAYAGRLGRDARHEVTWPSQQGGQGLYAHLIHSWIRKLGPTLVLITCHDPDQPLKTVRYWGSTVLDLSIQELVDVLAIHWEIETFFECEQDLSGSDHYQLMKAIAI